MLLHRQAFLFRKLLAESSFEKEKCEIVEEKPPFDLAWKCCL